MLTPVDPKSLELNVFTGMGDEWFLITAGDGSACNTMTASWGGLGVLWGEPCATVYIRPQRYTTEFVDGQEYFTLSFFGPEWRQQLALCGAKSGRELDKIKECGFTLEFTPEGAPMFRQARLTLVCRKLYAQPMDPQAMPAWVRDRWYPQQDYHTMYVGQIVRALLDE